MIARAWTVINTRTGLTLMMSWASLEVFDFGPDPSIWRVCS